MAVGEERPTQKHRRKMPSFSSSLLDAIYHSIDEPLHHHPPPPHRRNAADEEIESLRRAIMIEKWIENYTTTASSAAASRHLPSHSASSTSTSTDSCSIFTSSETTTTTDSSSTPKPAPFPFPVHKPNKPDRDRETRFTRTKSKALKLYGDLKKVKEPISPGGRIANFLNSIFSPRNLKLKRENNTVINPDWSSVRKSRSMKDTCTTSLQSRSCLTKNTNPSKNNNNKSKRSVRFCPVSVNILDEDDTINNNYNYKPTSHSLPASSMAAAAAATANVVVGSRFIKKNMDSIRMFENDHRDFDDKSCASSDLFELENFGAFEAELPVYGTTDLRINRAIATRDS